jgi:hypothetical protein
MFVVFACFDLFVYGGSSLGSVPLLFVATVLCAAVLGDLVARFYSEPMNWLLRRQWRGKAALDSHVTADAGLKPSGA